MASNNIDLFKNIPHQKQTNPSSESQKRKNKMQGNNKFKIMIALVECSLFPVYVHSYTSCPEALHRNIKLKHATTKESPQLPIHTSTITVINYNIYPVLLYHSEIDKLRIKSQKKRPWVSS